MSREPLPSEGPLLVGWVGKELSDPNLLPHGDIAEGLRAIEEGGHHNKEDKQEEERTCKLKKN